MRVYHAESTAERFRRVPGPPDLTPIRGGVIAVLGDVPAPVADAVAWAAQIGLFVARGGDVIRREPPAL